MKKFGALLLTVVMVFTMAACTAEESPSTGAGQEGTSGSAAWEPSKPFKACIGYGAGGTTDGIMRPLFSIASNIIGENIVVENVAGGSGSISWLSAVEAPADGYTLIVGAETCALYDMYDLIPYTSEDVTVLMVVGDTPNFIYVKADSPYQTIEDLFEAEKADPGSILKTASGTVGINACTSALYKFTEGVEFQAYNADSSSSAVVTVLGGFADFGFSAYANVKDYVESGEIRLLASNTAEPILEGVPAMGEVFPEMAPYFPMNAFYCVCINKDCDPAIAEYLTEALTEAYNDPEFQEAMELTGVEALGLTGDEATEYIQTFRESCAKVLIEAGAIDKTMEDLGL